MKIIGALLLVGLAAPAGAQSLLPEPVKPGRYEMQPIEGGVARLDTLTGEVSLCRLEGGTLRCRPGEEGDEPANRPAAPEGEDRADRDGAYDDGDRSERPEPGRHERADSDAEFDKALSRMKQLFRAFGDVARDWEHGDGPQDENRDDDERMPERT